MPKQPTEELDLAKIRDVALRRESIVVAVPKGRILKQLAKMLKAGGVDASVLLRDDRTLEREAKDLGVRFLLLKPDDVPTYVEYGVADLGIVGRDVLLERQYDLFAPMDLGIGVCRMCVAGLPGEVPRVPGRPLRVATKFPNIATQHFMAKGEDVEIIFVQGSVELAPLTGLADVIVDLVESGETLRTNGLVEHETICGVSSVVVANRVGLKLKQARMQKLLRALEKGRKAHAATKAGAKSSKPSVKKTAAKKAPAKKAAAKAKTAARSAAASKRATSTRAPSKKKAATRRAAAR